MIHKYALIAEYEYDDENGEYTPPSLREVEQFFARAIERHMERHHNSLKENHFEIAPGSLHDAFGVGESK